MFAAAVCGDDGERQVRGGGTASKNRLASENALKFDNVALMSHFFVLEAYLRRPSQAMAAVQQ
jgi:hypothetical protein